MNDTVAVLGPGAVGGSLAVRLSLAGAKVVCVAHPESAGLIALAGLVVESAEGTLTARLEVAEQLARPVDLLLVTVKAPSGDSNASPARATSPAASACGTQITRTPAFESRTVSEPPTAPGPRTATVSFMPSRDRRRGSRPSDRNTRPEPRSLPLATPCPSP